MTGATEAAAAESAAIESAATDAEATGRIAETAMMRLHYHEAGPAASSDIGTDIGTDIGVDKLDHDLPVVLLHGGGPGASGWSNFGRNLPVFAERFRTLMPDQPGFGQSAAPPVEGSYFTFSARALASLLDCLGIEKVHLVGN